MRYLRRKTYSCYVMEYRKLVSNKSYTVFSSLNQVVSDNRHYLAEGVVFPTSCRRFMCEYGQEIVTRTFIVAQNYSGGWTQHRLFRGRAEGGLPQPYCVILVEFTVVQAFSRLQFFDGLPKSVKVQDWGLFGMVLLRSIGVGLKWSSVM